MISIIMPAYNVENYLAETIKSVQAQTYKDFELLIIDDGSIDDTRKVAMNFADDLRISYIHQENAGVSVARNTGLAKAKGEYISFLDADDLWEPEFLQKLLDKAAEGYDFVYARTEEFFPDGRKNLVGPDDCVAGKMAAFLHKTGEVRLRFHISAVLFKRELVEKYQLKFFPGIKQGEDTAFLMQLLCVTEAASVNEVLSYYRRRDGAATTVVWRAEDWNGSVLIYEKMEEFVKQQYPEGLTAFYKMRDYVTYRFVLKCLRMGDRKAVQAGIDRWRPWLQEFAAGSGKLGDRLKCRLILSGNWVAYKLAERL